jgi:hypothetical protein
MMMGAIRRWYDKSQPVVQSTGTGNAFVLAYPVAPAPAVKGDIVWWYPHTDGLDGGITLDIGDGNGPKALVKADGTSVPHYGGLPAAYPVLAYWDGGQWRIVFSTGFLFRQLGTPPYDVGSSGGVLPPELNGEIMVKNTGGAAPVITVQAGQFEGQRLRFKDCNGNAQLYPITIAATTSIDGAGNIHISVNYGATEIVWNGTQWGEVKVGVETAVPVSPSAPPITLTGTSSVTAAVDQDYYIDNTSAGIMNINLSAGAYVNQKLSFKDIAGNAGTYQINIVPGGGAHIDGLTVYPIVSNYSSLRMVWTGSNWGVV